MLGRASSTERGSLSRHGGGERLARRRRNRRRRVVLAFGVLFLLLFGVAVYGLRQSAVRISHIEVSGADDALSLQAIPALQGDYFGIIPRDSIFFFPEERIRAGILAARNDRAAVSISRNGFTGLSIKIDTRTPIARVCDSTDSPHTASFDGDCYFFDANGFIYATTSTMQPINSFIVYESGQTLPDARIGATLPNAEKLPAAFDFARQLAALGSPVTRIAFHDGEVDNYLESGTRITYVLGNEQNAFTALVSARENFNLADGSIDYIDLRFNGKMYLKKKSPGQ